MENTILDPLPFDLALDEVGRRLRLDLASRRAEGLAELTGEARALARPRGAFRLVTVAALDDETVALDGVAFQSRILRVSLDGAACAYPFVCTAGPELAAWAAGQPDPLFQFYADAVSQVVLRAALGTLCRTIREAHGIAWLSRLSPGSLPDWPLDAQRPLFGLLGDGAGRIGVTLTESLLMVPTKSVSGVLFAAREDHTSCRLCPRTDCRSRKAEHDPGLYAARYARRDTPPEGSAPAPA